MDIGIGARLKMKELSESLVNVEYKIRPQGECTALIHGRGACLCEGLRGEKSACLSNKELQENLSNSLLYFHS